MAKELNSTCRDFAAESLTDLINKLKEFLSLGEGSAILANLRSLDGESSNLKFYARVQELHSSDSPKTWSVFVYADLAKSQEVFSGIAVSKLGKGISINSKIESE